MAIDRLPAQPLDAYGRGVTDTLNVLAAFFLAQPDAPWTGAQVAAALRTGTTGVALQMSEFDGSALDA